jgi:hypothetical protein
MSYIVSLNPANGKVILDTTLCDKLCQWLATGQWFSPGTSVSSTNKTDHHDITEILLKVALNTINVTINSILHIMIIHISIIYTFKLINRIRKQVVKLILIRIPHFIVVIGSCAIRSRPRRHLLLNVRAEGCSRNSSCTLNLIFTFLFNPIIP